MTAITAPFSLNAVPEIHFGPGRTAALADDVAFTPHAWSNGFGVALDEDRLAVTKIG